MDFLPLFLNIKNKPCLVVGGGEVAARKVNLLRKAGASVTVVSPELCPGLLKLAAAGEITHNARRYEQSDLNGARLVIAATDNAGVNQTVSEQAEQLNIPVNVVDQPDLCSFIVPSIIDRSPVVAAVSTGGASPVLARIIRTRLETLIPAGYGRLAELANRFRSRVKERFENSPERRRFWEKVLNSGVAERVFSGHMEEAEAAMSQALENGAASAAMGEVYLVGGGPGRSGSDLVSRTETDAAGRRGGL